MHAVEPAARLHSAGPANCTMFERVSSSDESDSMRSLGSAGPAASRRHRSRGCRSARFLLVTWLSTRSMTSGRTPRSPMRVASVRLRSWRVKSETPDFARRRTDACEGHRTGPSPWTSVRRRPIAAKQEQPQREREKQGAKKAAREGRGRKKSKAALIPLETP